MVLTISEREEVDSVNTKAYGGTADCYTELGGLELATLYYHQYTVRLEMN